MTEHHIIRFTRGRVTVPVARGLLHLLLGHVADHQTRVAIERRVAGLAEGQAVELDPESFVALLDATSAWGRGAPAP
jgi:hypothetical protein